jgi:hypothetical protein
MKKIIFAVLAVLVMIGSAQATTLSVDVGTRIEGNNQFSRTSDIRLQDDKLAIQVSNSGNVSRVEGEYSLTPLASIPVFTVNAGLGVVTAGAPAHYTYSVEPKVTVPFGKFAGSVGYKYRNDLKSTIQDQTRVVTVGVSYAVTPTITALVKAEDSRGDYRYKGVGVGLAYNF